METVNSETLNKFSNEPTREDNSRLRSAITVNCLLKVFDYLDVGDLLSLYRMDPYFKDLILNRTLKTNIIKFPLLYFYNIVGELDVGDVDEYFMRIFKAFGKSMQKCELRTCDLGYNTQFTDGFTLLLKIIVQYCKPAVLTDILLEIANGSRTMKVTPTDQHILDLSIPFFSNLRKLQLNATCFRSDEIEKTTYRIFLTNISLSATNLKILTVKGVDITGGWLQNMKNLRELRILYPNSISYDDLVSCLKVNPELKVLKIRHIQKYELPTFGDDISQLCPRLENFADHIRKNTYSSLSSFDLAAIANRYNFLSKLSHLIRVELTSYTSCGCDLYSSMKILANSNVIQLRIWFPADNLSDQIVLDEKVIADIIKRPLPNFYNIQEVKVSPDPMSSTVSTFQFIFHLLKFLKNLKKFKVICYHKVKDIHKVLENAPNIQILDLYRYYNMEPNIVINGIVKVLRKNQQLGILQSPLHLVLDINLKNFFREFFEDDTKDIIRISYDGKLWPIFGKFW